MLCNKWTHHHHIPLVSSLPVDVYACVFLWGFFVFYGGTVMKTTVEAVSVVVFLTISPLDMLLTVDELDLALPPGFLFSTSVSTPPFTDLHALILIHWTGYSNF